jgi:hypothetical protein
MSLLAFITTVSNFYNKPSRCQEFDLSQGIEPVKVPCFNRE